MLQAYGFRNVVTGEQLASPVLMQVFVMGITLAHYFHDKIFWDGRENPRWQNRISPKEVPNFTE